MREQTQQRYHGLTRVLHWVSAVAIVGLFVLGLWMVELDYEHAWYDAAAHYHESLGVLAAVLVVFRLQWRLITPQPRLSSSSIWERSAARLAHAVMYGLCIVIFISGYLIPTADGRSIPVFDWFSVPALGSFHHLQADIAGTVHYYLAIALIALVIVHALAACKHHFVDKDDTLKKML